MGSPSLLDQLFIRNNSVSFMKGLDQRLLAVEVGDIAVRQLSDLSEDLGVVYTGNFIAGIGDPFDQVNGLFTGTAMVYPPITIGSDDYNIFGQNLGILEFGISATDGRAYFAAGAGIIDHTGIILRADVYPSNTYLTWKAVDTNGVIGQILGTYGGAAVNSGIVITGQAHDAGVSSFVLLATNDESGNQRNTFFVSSDVGAEFNFTNVADHGALVVKTKVSATNSLTNILYLLTKTSNTPTAGFGTSIGFFAQDSAGNDQYTGHIGIPYITTTNGAEDTKVQLGMVRKGASFSVPAGGAYADHYANVGNITTAETDLYSDQLIAGLLAENGDKVIAEYAGSTTNHTTATRRVRIYFGGTVIYDSTALVTNPGADWVVRVVCIRASSGQVRCFTFWSSGSSFAAPVVNYAAVTGLTLSNTQIIKITGQAAGTGAASNDIIAKAGTIFFHPAA